MTQCPYPENVSEDNIAMSNEKYVIWHECYEAHKFEMANQTIKIALLAQGLEDEIKKYQQLETELLAKETMKEPTG